MSASPFMHLHTHSHFSCLDAVSPVQTLIDKAVSNGQPGLALTDHGTMSGVFQLYKGCRKAGILPYPGVEAYVVNDITDKTCKRHHVTLFAFTNDGYSGLVQLVTGSHTRETYHYKPLMDWATLIAAKDAGLLDGVYATTGCWFGYVQQAIDENGGTNPARDVQRRMKFMAGIFPNLFVEIQHHNQPDDDKVIDLLYRCANAVGLPVVVTQDAHYCNRKDKSLHNMMKSLTYGGDPGDDAFPGDSYHLGTSAWVKTHYRDHPDIWSDAMDSMQTIIDSHAVSIPWLDSYQYHVPQIAKDPLKALSGLIDAGKAWRRRTGRLGASQKPYDAAIAYELDIIKTLGMADYFLLVHKVCEFMQINDITYTTRGSANGSIVCWFLGITDVDPVKWELSFDRFMSLDRERPPDIDLDVDRDRREEVVEFVMTEFEAMHIGTYSRMGVDDEGKGMILQSFLTSMRRVHKDDYGKEYGWVKTMDDVRKKRGSKFVRQLYALGDQTIYRSPGMHAAGLLLGTDDHPLKGQMPSMFLPSSKGSYPIASMMMMQDAEDGGWIKLDLLGSAMLTTITAALKMTGIANWNDIPLNDPATLKFLQRGETESGVFQLEGWTNAKGCKEMKVNSVDDLIVCNALYRPATINAGHKDSYIENRRSPGKVRYIHPLFEPILKNTYGLPVFQEQVMGMLRAIGFDTKDLNRMLKALKASNDKIAAAQQTFKDLRLTFNHLCKAQGFTTAQTRETWDFIVTFSDYSFNRSHATGYGLFGYYTAWLKVNHPLEFHTALLQTWAGTPKESVYVASTRRAGVRILGADVSISGANFTLDTQRGVIRRGLLSIKGVGVNAAHELADHRPYSSVQDIIDRCDGRKVTGCKTWPKEKKGVLAALEQAGALKSLKGADQ